MAFVCVGDGSVSASRGNAGEGMSKADALEEATSRLMAALEAFENTIAQRRHADLSAEALQEQIQSLTDSLGTERQRSERLSSVNEEVSQRLDSVIDSIRAMLQTA